MIKCIVWDCFFSDDFIVLPVVYYSDKYIFTINITIMGKSNKMKLAWQTVFKQKYFENQWIYW